MSKGVVDFGNGFVADFSDLLGTEGDTEALAETVDEDNAENAVPEEKEVADEPEKETPEPEPEKPSDKKEPEEKEAEKPAEPDTYEFDITYRGEKLKEKLTKEQVVARLQMAKDYTVKTEELSQKRRGIEAVEKLAQTPWFKEKYEEAIQLGVIETPAQAAAPDAEDVYEYGRRTRDADFDEIRQAMVEYALALPENEQEILKSNHRVFNREYDRFAAMVRKGKEKPADGASGKVDPAVTKKILQSKEVAKQQAIVEKPGVGSPDADPDRESRKRLAAVRKEAKGGNREAITKLAYFHMYGALPDF